MKTHFLFFLGWLSLGLGVLGVALPVLPTTPFVLLAAWCFLRSSPKWNQWIRQHSLFGPLIQDWEARGAIRRRTKVSAITLIAVSLSLNWWAEIPLPVKLGLTLLLSGVTLFILTRPE